MAGGRLNCLLVAGGKWHDIDFARLELLKLLAEDERIRVRVLEDYSDLAALEQSDFLVSYTCDVTPALAEQQALRNYVAGGRRWLALHGTNSILRFMDDGSIDTPNLAPLFMETLGTMFQAHPPIAPYRVEPTGISHPLVNDIDAFEVEDEQYLVKTTAPIEVLLDTEFDGQAGRFRANPWEQSRHPVLYLRHLGEGSVCYLTLGHCRGHYDLQPLMDFYPKVERGAWQLPVFHKLLRRGVRWAMKEL